MRAITLRALSPCLSLCLTFALLFAPAHAQEDRGRINGLVTDPTGAIIPRAPVTLLNDQQITVEGTGGARFRTEDSVLAYTVEAEGPASVVALACPRLTLPLSGVGRAGLQARRKAHQSPTILSGVPPGSIGWASTKDPSWFNHPKAKNARTPLRAVFPNQDRKNPTISPQNPQKPSKIACQPPPGPNSNKPNHIPVAYLYPPNPYN